ncbi:amino acid permease [Saccharopolyspora sp. ID03-671]|uniref:amino acid permease n=1 Tax=Saccharopolyspora sp. ID03-671 TaxID=3073066 RepID=UPI0032542C53
MPRTGLLRTKSVEQSRADTDEPDTRLRKNLSAFDLVMFGVAVTIGAGIFTMTARTAGNIAGPGVALSFVISAVACGLAALCYAEFASTVPVAGSAYTYSYATFGEFVAWILGWDLLLELALGSAVVAKGWSEYLQEALGLLGIQAKTTVPLAGFDFDWGAVVLTLALTVVLAVGIKLSARVTQVITLVKIAVVLLVIFAGLRWIDTANYRPFIPEPTGGGSGGGGLDQSLFSLILGGSTSNFGVFGIFAGAAIVFFAFIGFDVVATTAEETRNPQRDMPRGIMGSLAIVTVLYVAVALVVTGMVSYKELATKPDGTKATLATAFTHHGQTWTASFIIIGALAGLTTVVMVLMLGQIRVLFAMGRDGLIPRALAKTAPATGTPVRATVLVGIFVVIASGFFPASKLEEMVNVGTLAAFIMVSVGVVILRKTRPDLPRSFRTPLVPLVPILAVLACLWVMVNLTAMTWVRFLIWMAVGLVLYFAYGYRKSRMAEAERAQAAEIA